MLDLLNGFVTELRNAGLPVSLTESIDAMEAVKHIPLEDREAFKYALGATMVKSASHWRAFETDFRGVLLDSSRPARRRRRQRRARRRQRSRCSSEMSGEQAGGGLEGLTPEQFAEMLYKALMNADDAMIKALASQAVQRYAGMEPGRPVGGTYYLYRTLRNLDLEGMLERMMQQAQNEASNEEDGLTALEERLAHDEYQSRIEKLRQEIEAEIRRRLVADRGPEAMARTLRKPLARRHRLHARVEGRTQQPAQGDRAADAQAGRAPRAQASAWSQGSARLPQHGSALAFLRRGAGGAEVQIPASGQTGACNRRRHQRVGRRVRRASRCT